MVFGRSVAFEETGDFRDSEVLRSGFGLHFGPPSLLGGTPAPSTGDDWVFNHSNTTFEATKKTDDKLNAHSADIQVNPVCMLEHEAGLIRACLLSRKMMSDTVGQNLVCTRIFRDSPCLYIKATAACSS